MLARNDAALRGPSPTLNGRNATRSARVASWDSAKHVLTPIKTSSQHRPFQSKSRHYALCLNHRIFATAGSSIIVSDTSQSRSHGRYFDSTVIQENAWISFIMPDHEPDFDRKKHREKKNASPVKKTWSDADCSHHVAIENLRYFQTGAQEYFSIFTMSHVTDQDATNRDPFPPSGAAAGPCLVLLHR